MTVVSTVQTGVLAVGDGFCLIGSLFLCVEDIVTLYSFLVNK